MLYNNMYNMIYIYIYINWDIYIYLTDAGKQWHSSVLLVSF